MQTNNHKIVDYDTVLDAKFGEEGTPSRIAAEEKAFAFYTGQIIKQARKEAKMTQPELAVKLGSSKAYISKVDFEPHLDCRFHQRKEKCPDSYRACSINQKRNKLVLLLGVLLLILL